VNITKKWAGIFMHFSKNVLHIWHHWWAMIYTDRADAHLLHEEFEAAVADADRALRIIPNAADVLFTRARALHRLGRADDALRDLEAALKLEPRSASIYAYRALIHLERGNLEDAIGDANIAHYYNPTLRIPDLVRARADAAQHFSYRRA
jgi:tetratricopeptide (TPR) repeat protein